MNTPRFRSYRPFRAWLLLLIGLAALSSSPAQGQVHATARTLYVATTGGDSSSCGAATAPCRTIHRAAELAASGDTILVAGGTYTYNAAVDTCSFLVTRAVVCFVDKHLTILGGYSTGNWAVANPAANPTVIDGQSARRGVAVIAFNTTASLRMEGFTIQNGLAQGQTSGGDFNTFAFGGGIWAQTGSLVLRDMVFRNNVSRGGNTGAAYGGGGSGGGVAITSTKNGLVSVLERVRFEGNQALGGSGPERGGVALGGGLFTYEAAITGGALSFQGNRAQGGNSGGSGNSAGLQADGLGGGAAFGDRSSATLSYVTATRNQAVGGNAGGTAGGGYAGGLYAELSTITVLDSTVRENTAQGGSARNGGIAFGGGVMTFNSTTTLDRTQVLANLASAGSTTGGGSAGGPSGGGAYISDFTGSRRLTLTNSVFADNRMTAGSGTNPGGGGAGLVVQGMRADINHSTFARNTFGPGLVVGQAILVQGTAGASGTPGVANISYSILAEHTGTAGASTLHVSAGSTANLNRGLFAGNTKNTNADNQPLAAGAINGTNSMLSAASGGFVAPGSPSYNYRISSSSPAKDQATGSALTVDLDIQRRPVGSAADIGADEYLVLDRVARIPLVLR